MSLISLSDKYGKCVVVFDIHNETNREKTNAAIVTGLDEITSIVEEVRVSRYSKKK